MSDSPLAIGIDFGGTSVRVAVVFQRHIIDQAPPIATQEFTSPEELIAAMVEVVVELRARHPEVVAVGVGMPGFVNHKTGVVIGLTNVENWESIPLKSILTASLGMPVVVENDANCMAYGEWKFGSGRGYDHVIFMTLGTGVGGGVIANGQMVRGANFGAGEIGQTSIDYQGRRGHYGNLGALEDYVGNREIAASAKEAYLAAGQEISPEACTPEALAAAANRGNPVALALWDDIARKLATSAMNCCWLLNPEALVIGGGVARAGDVLFRPFRKHLFEQLSGPFKDDLRVIGAALCHEAGTIGAAALARDHVQQMGTILT